MEKKFIILVVSLSADGTFKDPEVHDEAASPKELMARSSFRGEKPLMLGADGVAYIFQRGGTHPIRIGLNIKSGGAGTPRWV